MKAPFTFSQRSLQDYADCPRRFQLRYLLDVRWPAAPDELPAERERRMQQGITFHRLLYRHLSGVPAPAITATVPDGDLRRWWLAYLNYPPRDLPTGARHPEVRLSVPLGDHRLVARYDLLAIDPGKRAVIVDWKTDRDRPSRVQLARRMQTLVYRYVLVEGGTQFNGGLPIAPDRVELVYWFANYPAQVERFDYDVAQHRAVAGQLASLIAEIAARREEVWPLADDERRCRFCTYNTLCMRGTLVSLAEEDEGDDELFDLDLEQVAEIEF